jgi:hypothetical protein
VSERDGVYVEDADNLKILKVVSVCYPLGTNYCNNYYDGVEIVKGKTRAKVHIIGGGNGWARRGSLVESWNEFSCFIDASEFDELVQELLEILKINDDIDKEAKLKDFADKIFYKFLDVLD